MTSRFEARTLLKAISPIVFVAAACSPHPPYNTELCADAAAEHALAEQRWLDAVQEHAVLDATVAADLITDHEHNHSRLVAAIVAARVDAPLAEAATHYHCE